MSLDIPTASYVRLSLFPAEVTPVPLPSPPLNGNLKLMVTDSYMLLFEDSPNGPVLTHKEEIVSFAEEDRAHYSIQTPSNTYQAHRATGCGCGSRLRGFNPFRGVPFKGGPFA